MKLLAKFNLVYLLVMSLGIALSGYIARNLLQENAQQETVASARMLMEKALAVRNYTNTQIKPLLSAQMAHEFLPQTEAELAEVAEFVLQFARPVWMTVNEARARGRRRRGVGPVRLLAGHPLLAYAIETARLTSAARRSTASCRPACSPARGRPPARRTRWRRS